MVKHGLSRHGRTPRRRPTRPFFFRPVLETLEERLTPTPVDAVNFTETSFVTNAAQLGSATGLAWAPDGSNRLFVIRKGGEVRIVQDGALLSTPFATVSPVLAS